MLRIILLVLVSVPLVTHSQSIQRQAIGSIGGSANVGSVSISHVVGQPYQTKSLHENQFSLRQGFEQPTEIKTSNVNGRINFLLFPNPTANRIALSSSESLNNIVISVTDILGRKIYSQSYLEFVSTTISFLQFENGVYLLNLHYQNELLFSSKIIFIQ